MPIHLSRDRVSKQLEQHLPPVTLLTGTPDSGTFSLARHLASHHGILDEDRLEVQALYRDTARDVILFSQTEPFGKLKLVILQCSPLPPGGGLSLLLKLLEEPPLRLKFILLATSSHTFPSTVLSRCQHYYVFPMGTLESDVPLSAVSSAQALIRSVAMVNIDLFDRVMHSMTVDTAEVIRSQVLEQLSLVLMKKPGCVDIPKSLAQDMIIALSKVASVRPRLALRTALEPLFRRI